MKNKEEIELLQGVLDDMNTKIDYIYTFIAFTRLFTNIEDLRKFLIIEHDIGVDEYNLGLKRLKELEGEKHGRF